MSARTLLIVSFAMAALFIQPGYTQDHDGDGPPTPTPDPELRTEAPFPSEADWTGWDPEESGGKKYYWSQESNSNPHGGVDAVSAVAKGPNMALLKFP